MAQGLQISRAYGFNGYVNVFPLPIVTTVAPVNGTDTGLSGQVWINTTTSTAYIMANPYTSTWVTTSAGTGTFANLTVTPGPTSLTGLLTTISGANATNIATDAAAGAVNVGTTGARTVTLGSITAASTTVLQGASVSVNVLAAGTATFGSNATQHNTTVGSLTGTSVLTLQGGNTTGTVITAAAGGAVSVSADGSANTINVGTGAAAKTVVVGSATAGSTLNVFTPTAGVGTGLRINNGAAVAAIYVGTGVPGFVAVQGSLFIRTDATTTTSRLYIYTDGGAWATFTTSS